MVLKRPGTGWVSMTSQTPIAEFTTLVAHELKEPLRRISLNSELLGDLATDPSCRRALRALQDAVAAADAMVDAVCSTMQGKGSDRHDWELIQRAVVTSMAIPKGFRIRWDHPLPAVEAPLQLQYVLRTLISNAIKHHDRPEGRIAVRGRGMTIEVVDDGPGYRHNVAEHAKKEGLGLGLTLARRLVERHGGVLVLDDIEPRGTRVSFTWPREGASDAVAARIASYQQS